MLRCCASALVPMKGLLPMLLSVKQHHFPNLRCAYTSLSRGPTSLQHPALRGMKRGRPKGWGPNKDDSEVDDEKNNSNNNNNSDNKSGSLENSAAAFNAVQVLQSGPMARMTPYVNTEVGRIKDGGLVGSSTAFTYRILGTETQIVEVNLTPGAAVRAETGSMLFMTDGVQMETSTAGGFMQGLKRAVTGESFFMSDFTFPADYTGSGQVTLGASHPCKIIPIDLSMFGGHLVCARGSYIAGSSKLQIEPFTAFKLSAGFFGGEGFVLQNIIGSDTVLVKGGGVVLTRDLQAGEILRVSTGCLLAFEGSVQYDIQRVGGFKNILFGGEGLFVATLMGPGRVFIQALPFDHLAASIAQRIPRGGGGTIIPVGGGGMGGGGAGGVEAGGGGGGEGSAGDVGSGGGMPSDTGSAKDYESFEQKDDDDDDSGGGIGGGDDSDSGIGWLKKLF